MNKYTKILILILILILVIIGFIIYSKKSNSVEIKKEMPETTTQEVLKPITPIVKDKIKIPKAPYSFSDKLQAFGLTNDSYNELKIKIMAKNYRYKIQDFTIYKRNTDQTLEITLKLESSNKAYYINALIDQNTGLILKTWGQTRYETPEPPVITLPAQ